MTRWQKFFLFASLAASWKNAVAGATAVTAGVAATTIGVDPWPWVIGSGGATAAFLLRPPIRWQTSLANGIISIFCGGLIGPFASAWVATKIDPLAAHDLVYAGIFSMSWPWIAALAAKVIERWFGAAPSPSLKP